MSSTISRGRIQSTLRHFLDNEASGGVILMFVATLAIATANSQMADAYFTILHVYIGPLSIAAGLLLGKLVGVLGTVAVLVNLKLAELPAQASWGQMAGVALLCGIGFTMSLFIGLLAFNDPNVQDHVKIGILLGSLTSGLIGAVLLTAFGRRSET